MTEELKLKIKEIIINKFKLNIDTGKFEEKKPFIEYGVGLDSVANLELILEIEKKLKINIDEAEIDNEILFNFKSLYDFINKRV
jgi:acyl carrier protein